MSGVVEGLVTEGLWAGLTVSARRLLGGRIRIISPKASGYLDEDRQTLGQMTTYNVRGTLKRLARGHEIWLLRQDEISSKIWPQGFSRVVFDADSRQWHGRVNGTGQSAFRIIAVVAPPTSHDFFRYCQKVGNLSKHFEPIDRIPPECTNFDYVQVRAR
jgi:hypothetical protein